MRLTADLKVVALCSDDRASPRPVRAVKGSQGIPVLFGELFQSHTLYSLK